MPVPRPLRTAELLAVGTEITVGETLDTNSGELARSLVELGIAIARVTALPDEPAVLEAALRDALARADLVVTTGGLGPTPDDCTREAVAAVTAERPEEDAATLAWLEGIWSRRGLPFPAVNRKQAWRIPSATLLPNPNGTAPGWWTDRPDGAVIVSLPGPPREMRPMWRDHVVPRLAARGTGGELVVRTLRCFGIGESLLAERLGDALLRRANPVVATYARAEAVDVRISARPGPGGGSAVALADAAEAEVLAHVADHVWARGSTTWAEAVDAALVHRGWRLATVERGTRGALAGLLRGAGSLVATRGDGRPDADPGEAAARAALLEAAEAARTAAGCEAGLAVSAHAGGEDTAVTAAVVTPEGARTLRSTAFLQGRAGEDRAAMAAAATLLELLEGAPRVS